MKAAKTRKILKEMPYPPQKKLLKRKGNSIIPAKTNAPISQTSSERLKLTKEKFTLYEVILKEQQKYLQSFINNSTYHPINHDADVTYETVNLFSSDKCFIYFISHVPHYT